MSTIQLDRTFANGPEQVFEAASRAVDHLGQYKVIHVHSEICSGEWSWSGPPRLFLQIDVVPQADGSRVKLELRDADLRDRIGLRRREARRVLNHVAAHVQAGASGLQVVDPAPAPLTDRMVLGRLLGAVLVLAVLGSLFQCVVGLFR